MQNLEIERLILSQILLDQDLLLEYPVQESDFVLPLHQRYFELIKRFAGNLAIIQEKLQAEEYQTLLEIAGLALGTWRRKTDWQELKRLAELRRLAGVAKEVLSAVEHEQDLENIYEKIQRFDT